MKSKNKNTTKCLYKFLPHEQNMGLSSCNPPLSNHCISNVSFLSTGLLYSLFSLTGFVLIVRWMVNSLLCSFFVFSSLSFFLSFSFSVSLFFSFLSFFPLYSIYCSWPMPFESCVHPVFFTSFCPFMILVVRVVFFIYPMA